MIEYELHTKFIFCDFCIPPGLIYLVLFEMERNIFVNANSWLKHQLYFWDAFILLTLFFRYMQFIDLTKHFYLFLKNDHSYSKSTVSTFFLTESLTLRDSGKFEKNWGQICYCVLTPSIATSSFLTAWKLVFFPRWSWPQFSYGASILWC